MRNDFIAHSAKGHTWSNHRYIAKVRLPSGRMFYFYDQKAYQSYLKRINGGGKQTDPGQLTRKEPYAELKGTSTSPLRNYSKQTTQQKKQTTNQFISSGKAAVQTVSQKAATIKANSDEAKKDAEVGKAAANEVLGKAKGQNVNNTNKTSKSKSSSKKSSGTSSKKSSGTSKKSSGTSSKKSSSESSKKSSSSGSSSKGSSAKETETKEKENNKAKTLADGILKMLGAEEKDVNNHKSYDNFVAHLSTYRNGSHGYIMVGDKAYRWTKNNGKISIVDINTDKEVSISILKNAKNIREISYRR